MRRTATLNSILNLGRFLAMAGLSLVACNVLSTQNQQTNVVTEAPVASEAITEAPDEPEAMTEAPEEPVPEPENGPTDEETPMTSGESSSQTQGLAISQSDTADLEDSVLTAGEVLFIPEQYGADLAATGGFDPSNISGMRHAFFELTGDGLSGMAGNAATIGPDGRFNVNVSPGRYFVCLADTFVDHTAGPPYSVVGCDIVDLPGDAALTVSSGEGGVQATLE